MAEPAPVAPSEQALVEFVTAQRWYGSKSREVVRAHIVETVPLETISPRCAVALVEVRFQPGTHETYQLPLAYRPAAEGATEGAIDEVDGWTVLDGLAEPAFAREVVDAMRSGRTLAGGDGTIELRLTGSFPAAGDPPSRVVLLGAEQSNSSLVLDDSLILKVYRRLEAGINPELELLRFLTLHDFPNIAALRGWYEYAGRPIDATLGLLQDYVPAGSDGWTFALDALESDPEEFIAAARRLGEVTGAMHAVLASDTTDPNFAVEEASAESLALLVASVDEEVERIFVDLPDDLEALAPIARRGDEVRDQLRMLSHAGTLGRVIRHHGDLHLGQVLRRGDDWIMLDFEGEPARSLSERRQKRSPLRDVAGMLRSFAYAASAAPMLRDVEVPPDFEQRAREEFLTGYRATVDSSLLPPSEQAIERLLSVFELEKAVYELRYELDNRPEWIGIPVAGIERLLGAGVP